MFELEKSSSMLMLDYELEIASSGFQTQELRFGEPGLRRFRTQIRGTGVEAEATTD